MGSSQEFSHLYKNVSENLSGAMANIATLKIDNKDGKEQLTEIMDTLSNIQSNFDGELKMLEENAEWEKFTMAFFGETNAGKSTIIESLRILFKEEKRQALLEKNAYNLQKFEQELTEHVNNVRNSINEVYVNYAATIEKINSGISNISKIMKDESSTRVRRKNILAGIIGAVFGGASVGIIMYLQLKG